MEAREGSQHFLYIYLHKQNSELTTVRFITLPVILAA